MTLILLSTLQLLLTLYMIFILFEKSEKIKTKDALLAKISLDYVGANRKAQKIQKKYDQLITIYGKEVGFNK